MKKYGKIICGALQVPQNYPCSIELDGKTIHNPTEEQYLAAGYLPIEESDEPEPQDGKATIANHTVREDGTKIVQSWVYQDVPEPTTEESATEEKKTTTKKKSTK